jgi:hypothetical protein
MSLPEPLPREFPKDEDQSLVKRNKRMLGKLLVGTLEKFQQEDKKLSNTEAYMRRSEVQRKADQKAREESERLRQQEREQAIEKRKRDMMLRARVAAKAEEKRLELLYMQWAEHHKKLSNFLRLFLFLVQKYPYWQLNWGKMRFWLCKSWCLMFIGVSISILLNYTLVSFWTLLLFVRTTAEPPIYYMPAKPIIDDPAIAEENKEKVFSALYKSK